MLGFVVAALEHANLRKARRRRDAARTLARGGELAHCQLELRLGGVDASVRRVDVGTACPAEGKQRDVVVRAHEVVEDRTPLLRPLVVSRSLACKHQRAADVRERLQRGGLATGHRRHRLVQPGQAAFGFPCRDFREAELRQRAQLEVRVAGRKRDLERARRQRRSRRRVQDGFGAREIEPPALGAWRDVAQEALGACEPPA